MSGIQNVCVAASGGHSICGCISTEKGYDCLQALGSARSVSVAVGLFGHPLVLCLQHKGQFRRAGMAAVLCGASQLTKGHLVFFSGTACTQDHNWGKCASSSQDSSWEDFTCCTARRANTLVFAGQSGSEPFIIII